MATMYDSINPDAIPADAELCAGYVDGRWPSYQGMVARFGRNRVVSITVTGEPGARVADVERGDLTPQQAAIWAKNELAAGRRPTIYTNLSTWDACKQALQAQGIDPSRVDWWIARPGPAELVPGTVATQYAFDVNGCDLSITDGSWPFMNERRACIKLAYLFRGREPTVDELIYQDEHGDPNTDVLVGEIVDNDPECQHGLAVLRGPVGGGSPTVPDHHHTITVTGTTGPAQTS